MENLGADSVSSDAGSTASAPPPDTAATSAPAPADATPAPADAGTPDVAASTETGAPATSGSLDELYQKFSKQQQEEAAPKAQPDAAKAPDDSTAKPDKPEEKPAGEEKPEVEQTEAPEAEEPKAEPDPLADEQTIPTRDQINEDYKRAPKAIRDLAADLAERLAAREAVVSKIGGDEGLQVAEAIIPHLFEARVTPENANAMFETLVGVNPSLVATMGGEFVNAALTDERTGAAFGDRLLESEFGEGYKAELIRKLVEGHREGLIDLEGVEEGLGTAREPTARERELEGRLKEAEGKVKELTGGKEDATRKEEQRLATTVKETVSRAVMAKVLPIAEDIGWVEKEGDTGPHAGLLAELGELAVAKMNAAIERTPEWDAIQQLVKDGNAFRDGQPTRLMRIQLEAVQRRGTALFKGTARRLKPVIGLLAGQAATPKTEDPPPPPTGRSEGGEKPQTDAAETQQRKPRTLDEIHEEFQRRQRDQQAAVGTLRR